MTNRSAGLSGRPCDVVIDIDGSQGEGGGQVLRTALTLSACLGKAITIRNIRANRAAPGLRPQHLAAVQSIARVCGIQFEEIATGQTELVFDPGPVSPGAYVREIGTAGSVCLVLQTMALPLALAEGPSILKITGGTHNPRAPSFDYLATVWAPFMRRIGLPLSLGLQRHGFYPRGGGVVVVQIDGGAKPDQLKPVNLTDRGEWVRLTGAVKIANNPMGIGYRMRKSMEHHLSRRKTDRVEMEIQVIEADDPAAVGVLAAEFEHARTTVVGVSSRGKSPESTASDVVNDMADFLDAEKSDQAVCDPYAADQFMLPLALIPGESRYTTSRITNHCLTNAAVIEQMTDRIIKIDGEKDKPGQVTIK